jgi:hypothetical protein
LLLKVGVKYCGGCNPRYERKQFLNRLQKELEKECVFEIAKENTLYDMILVLGGCSNCCADYSELLYRYEALCVRDSSDYEKIFDLIKEILHKK